MKFNFRKVASVLAGAIMLGSTAGFALAANYPSPFIASGAPNAVIVTGSNAPLDSAAATSIQTDLNSKVTTTAATATAGEGDKVKIERSSDKFNLGDNASAVFVVPLDEDNLPTLLAKGTYTNLNNSDYDYTQKVDLSTSLRLTHFSDSDYKDKVPTIGIDLGSSAYVMNYTVDFTTNPPFDNSLETTTMKLMGKNYYVLDVASNELILLDDAASATITEGETSSIQTATKTYSVGISFIDTTKVKLIVDGTTTNSLGEGDTYKLSGGDYVAIKDIMYNAKDAGISKVEISIGSGKLTIVSGSDIELNDDSVTGVVGTIVNSSGLLDKVVIGWVTDDDAFVTADQSLEMPGFKAIKVSMAGMTFPKSEEVKITPKSDYFELNVPIKSGTANIGLLYMDSTGGITGIGESSTDKLVTNSTLVGVASRITFNNTNSQDKYFVATWNGSSESESYLLSATAATSNGANRTTIKDEVTRKNICEDVTAGNTCSIGNVILYIDNISVSGSNKWTYINGTAGVNFNTLYTAEGMKIYLPYIADTASQAFRGAINLTESTDGQAVAGHGNVSWYMYMSEEDKDGKLQHGTTFYATLTSSTEDKPTVSAITGTGDTSSTGYEIGDSNDYEYYVQSDLGTKVLLYTGGDQDNALVTYAGEQSYADIYVTAPSVAFTVKDTVKVIKDTDTIPTTNNLIVVGGSCVNSLAAKILGVTYPTCGTASGIAADKYLIKVVAANSVVTGSATGNVAVLVAGFEAADTQKAAQKLIELTTSTDVGQSVVGPATGA
jgi:hypothetical protein